MNKPKKKTAAKKTATDKRMDTVLRKMLATPPDPTAAASHRKPGTAAKRKKA